MFGLSKLATAGIGFAILIAIAASVWFYGFHLGQKNVENQNLKDNIEQVETARQADDKAIERIIREFTTIEKQTVEVKEVVNETPPENINDVSLARLERVWRQQQQAASSDNSTGSTTDVR